MLDYLFKNVYIRPQKLQKKYRNVTEHLTQKIVQQKELNMHKVLFTMEQG
jgi:hypothetical protein